ncbi:ABC transporter permease [Conexibacter sp. CPCC 206217]|uniref:ABC transporter permease n=1 Tax=Conexibacter sp. CPCC 206217 TaxID=3064574 RepID=UPI00271E6878|nr:ABC transporter permease [Conexibacter sp. CPCC 206217]MDO8212224.1 ABC transporter permease [Conexibacter sp. CPCC 206217]
MSAAPAHAAAEPEGSTPRLRRPRRLPPGAAIVLAYIALLVGGRLAYPGFFDGQNLENLLRQNVGLGLTALGVGFVIICGGWDLSVGSTASLAGVVFARVALDDSVVVAAFAGLAAALAAGVVNGLLVTRLRLDSFMATLATGVVISGLALTVSVSGGVTVDKSGFSYLGLAHWLGIPLDLIILVVMFVLGGVLLARMRFGQHVHAVGGDPEAARLAGIPVKRVRVLAFAMSGALAGLAGLIATSKVGLAQADANASLTLDAIAVVVVGGISIRGGEGAVWRIALGLLILATLNNLFDALQWSQQVQEVAKGGVILLALGAELLSRNPGAWRRRLRLRAT